MRVRGLYQMHSSTPASSGERPGGSAVLHPRPLSKQACMRNSCIRGKQTDTSQCLHTHLLPRSHRRALKNALMQITYIKTSVPLGGELLSSAARSCTLKRFSVAPRTRFSSHLTCSSGAERSEPWVRKERCCLCWELRDESKWGKRGSSWSSDGGEQEGGWGEDAGPAC